MQRLLIGLLCLLFANVSTASGVWVEGHVSQIQHYTLEYPDQKWQGFTGFYVKHSKVSNCHYNGTYGVYFVIPNMDQRAFSMVLMARQNNFSIRVHTYFKKHAGYCIASHIYW